jgi:hypothetical protein
MKRRMAKSKRRWWRGQGLRLESKREREVATYEDEQWRQ